ncbi:MAG: MATE family efflux transporter [Clostridia bacterium]|nr:MATE family efflux transporter [Clostridia bacterium]
MTAEEKIAYLTYGKVKKLILKFAVPTVLTMLVTTFYNMADAYFVGKINPSASGAVSVIFSFMAIIQACGFFFGHGSGNYISRKLGEGNIKEAEKMAVTGFTLSLVFGLSIAVVGLVSIGGLAEILGSTPTIKPYAVDYLRFILIGAPYMTAALTLNNQLRFQGSALYAMIGMCAGGLINVGLDAWFIIGLNMGTAGAGLATAISQLSSFALLIAGTFRGGNIRLDFKKIALKPFYFAEIARGGLPSLGRQGISALSVTVLNHACSAVVSSPDELIAAMGIVAKITGFFSSAIIGFGQGFQPVCGFNYGAGKYDRVKEGFYFSVAVTTSFALSVGFLGAIFSDKILFLFTDSVKVVEYGRLPMITQCSVFFLTGYITILNMLLQNIGKVAPASLLSVARQGLFFIPALALLSLCFGVVGLSVAQAVSDAMTFIVACFVGKKTVSNSLRSEEKVV